MSAGEPHPTSRLGFAVLCLVVAGVLAAVAAVPTGHVVTEPTSDPAAVSGASDSYEFVAFTRSGDLVLCAELVALSGNGRHNDSTNDALVESATLRAIRLGVVECSQGFARVTAPRLPAASLALAWPASSGYGTVIIDLTDHIDRVLNVAIGQQAANEVFMAVSRRPWLHAPPNVLALLEQLRDLNRRLAGMTDLQERAAVGDTLYDRSVLALGALFDASDPDASQTRWWGLTFDKAEHAPSLQSIKDLAPGKTWVRLVMHVEDDPAMFRRFVDDAHRNGVRVMGQISDSSQMAQLSLGSWRARVDELLTLYPDIDAWEVGNEVNGSWAGTDVVGKIRYAAQQVKARTRARTLLTLYWELGEDTARSSLFNWIDDELPHDTRPLFDDVGLSVWVESNPMGISTDRVLWALHDRFPGTPISITEVGVLTDRRYADWWFGQPKPSEAAVAIAAWFHAAARSQPWLRGGGFWWTGQQDATSGTPLWSAIQRGIGHSNTG